MEENKRGYVNGYIKEGVFERVDFKTKSEFVDEDSEHRFVTDKEKENWNEKAEKVTVTEENPGLMSSEDKVKLDGIEEGANNFTYSHPTGSGNKHIPAGGEAGQVLKWSDNGTAVWGNDKDTTYGAATGKNAGLMSAIDKAKLDGIAAGANNFTYSHPTGSGNKHVPAGGSTGQILRWASDGTAVWGNDKDTTYGAATGKNAGLMSAADKAKLDGIAAGANKYVVPGYTSLWKGNAYKEGTVLTLRDNLDNYMDLIIVVNFLNVEIKPLYLNYGGIINIRSLNISDKLKTDSVAFFEIQLIKQSSNSIKLVLSNIAYILNGGKISTSKSDGNSGAVLEILGRKRG